MLNEFQSFESGAAFLAPKNSGPISPHAKIYIGICPLKTQPLGCGVSKFYVKKRQKTMRDRHQRSCAPGHLRPSRVWQFTGFSWEKWTSRQRHWCHLVPSVLDVRYVCFSIKNDPMSKFNMVMSENGDTGIPQ